MTLRYFVEPPISSDHVSLEGAELHHLAHVMRAKPGDEVILFDGSGCEFIAKVAKLGRNKAELEVVSREEVDRELQFPLVLGVALPKGDRQRWLIEKAVELGVTKVQPLVTRRGVAQPVDNALARLARGSIEASKQCGRNKLLEILEPLEVEEFVQSAPTNALRLIAHPRMDDEKLGSFNARISKDQPVYLAIGPEGGFTDEEVATAIAAGWQAVDLGRTILRIETAALALVARVTM